MLDPSGPPAKRTSQLRRLLATPEARPRVKRAVGSLLAVGVVSIGVIGALIIWHLIRRGRLIREGLPPPREVELPDLSELPGREEPQGRS